jgi:hypothetical protein
MSQNLKLPGQNYCWPATVNGKSTLFRLEKACEQGKARLVKAPKRPFSCKGTIRLDSYRPIEMKLPVVELPVFHEPQNESRADWQARFQ